MGEDLQVSDFLGAIEEALAQYKPFGDSNYIREQLELTFRRRLNRISVHLPVAGKLLDIFGGADAYTRYRIVGNTVIRCAVQQTHTQVETNEKYGLPLQECEKVFEAVIRHIQAGKTGTPFENGSMQLQRLGPETYHGWIWREDYPDDVFGRCFREILKKEYGESLVTIDDDELAMLRKGERLLQELLPSLAPSALSHAHLVGCFPDVGFWKGKVSSSQIRMGGIIFLNRQILRHPYCVAEHLLHESLHQKLYDFRHGHTLLETEYTSSPKVCSLWNAGELNKANYWDTHRAFAAFHVYVQLSLLALVAENRANELEDVYGPCRGLIESRNALERARYLGEKLKDLCADEMGFAGKRMLDWLMTILDFLDQAPPPKGATVHLLLDLYRREANLVDTAFSQDETRRSGLAPLLTPLVETEVESVRSILSSVGAKEELAGFNGALDTYADTELGAEFPTVRRLVANTLLRACPDGYRLTSLAHDGEDPDIAVREMVESGSEQLYLIQENVPLPVASARRRARDYRFTKSCEDNVGRLLAVLAAAVPPGGRILEIGAGVGVGLSWITAGLKTRTDVEVVSIEADPKLMRAAKSWSWPAYVTLIENDVQTILGSLGEFDLVFADAAPVKYGKIGPTLAAIRSGGILVVDDLIATPKTTDVQQAEQDGLRHALYNHPELQATELSSSGVMLATKSRAAMHAKVGVAA